MKTKFLALCVGAVVAPFVLSQSVSAQVVEQGDAPETIAGAQVTEQPGFFNLTTITGTLSSATDADLYRIFIQNPASFSATTVNAVTGTSLDTQLFIFQLNGTPVYMNDNEPSGASLQSRLPAGNALRPTTAGYYIIGISLNGYNPVDDIGQLLFANGLDTDVRGPNANNNGRPLDRWSATFAETGGPYRIDFTGTLVPEPSTWALLAVGAALVGRAAVRRRRQASV